MSNKPHTSIEQHIAATTAATATTTISETDYTARARGVRGVRGSADSAPVVTIYHPYTGTYGDPYCETCAVTVSGWQARSHQSVGHRITC